MTEIPLPDPALQAVDLLATETMKGGDGTADAPFADLFAMGAAGAIPLSGRPSWMDGELAEFLEREAATARYYLVHLACDFRPREAARVTQAWIKVGLQGQPAGAALPLAWSMDPLRLADKAEENLSAKISGSATLFGAEISASEKLAREDPYLLAHGLQGSEPYWEINELPKRRLEGVHRLKLVVRVPIGSVGRGVVVVDAAVQHRKLLLSRKADLRGLAQSTFELG